MMKRLLWLLLPALCITCTVQAQQKKKLPQEDYGKWQAIGASDLSPDGQWLAYQITVQEDNDTLYVVNRASNQSYKLEFASSFEFSKDNKWLAYRIGLSFREAEKLRDQNRPIEYKMGLLNLQTGKKEVIQNVSRFSFSRDGKFLAVSLTPPKDNKDKGSVLLVKNMADNSTHTIGNVTEYLFNKKSDYLAYIVESANTAGNAVELLNLSSYNLKVVASDTSKFSRLNWQKEGEGLSFYKTFKKDTYEEENAMVYVYTGIYQTPTLKIFDPLTAAGFPKDMRVFNGSALRLSDDMNAVFFGLKAWTPKPKKEERKPGDTTKAKADSVKTLAVKKDNKDEKLPGVDIWHWKDPEIQPRQKITFGQDKDASFLSVWNISSNAFHQLAKENTPVAQLGGKQQYAVIATDKMYKPAFKEDYADFYLVNARTGEEKPLYTKMLSGFYTGPQSSPDGQYLYFFRDKNWWSYHIATQKETNLTGKIGSAFWNTKDDHTASKPPFGIGGWLKDDREVLLYDEFNIWAVKPDGSASRKLTSGEKEEIVYRLNRVDFEDPYIDDSKALYLSAYGDKSKKFGYAKLENNKVTPLMFEPLSISRLIKAKDSDVFSYVKQDYNLSPELYVTDNFAGEKKVAATNPQQDNYYWGKSELISFTNKKGKKMQGALFYPADYEPGKQYPMIVYIYELLSNTVHSYVTPSVRSPYNTTNFSTNGYFIFRPDIVYDTNEPGMSAANCVIPAVEQVLKTGMIDRNKVGLMGHSWGAYQTAFLVTQTDIFKAACAGAPLTDLISMSLSIYWNSGTPDQKIFETSQGRFDGPWYERTDHHIRNSPMFNASKIKAPLLVAFGDKDGAVDWHQGIEMYGTMRRMEKPHVMLVYADENHGLAKKENQIDYQKRQREWFDHYLLGKPAEKWITDGVSYLDKMKEREKQTPTPAMP
ncbi:S9 family peptidase [Sediminibacterium ginsengisoli]|uniref:Dipeptidyl aminopeptidase/acylaminoacyl peptidase n=1 Tax=Sediminibacterium ginsengisoli TaxID=413434 RepID=A0A1T4QF22_9BACT|nr:prolyl oligopeptidase family serine peptidase [Sediminibacterium ginsengisoli]SKA02197.1 Dipeptidyl aminopeptidase/acylaminoacyl peptidase [Sediminibacterium ginsengisoli]